MLNPLQPLAVAALQQQHYELGVALGRLERLRRELIPVSPPSWKGSARHAFDAAIDGLVATTDAGIGAVGAARYRTQTALYLMGAGV